MSFCLNDISIIPRIEIISVSDPLLSLKTRITKKINIKYPFVASPMDSVINYEMAILMANYGIVPIFNICESNHTYMHSVIKQYIEQNDGMFGISIPASLEFLD